MMKRERDEVGDKVEGMANGTKMQRVAGQFSDRAGEESRGAGSQDVVCFPALALPLADFSEPLHLSSY